MESDFVNSEYRDIRERQMKELELTDDLLNKPPVRSVAFYSQYFSALANIFM